MRDVHEEGTRKAGRRGGTGVGSGRRAAGRILGAVCAAGALTFALPVAASAATMETPGQQRGAAATYWSFDNAVRGCLTGGNSDVAFETVCSGTSQYQDWYWTGPQHDMLANRATGKCLATDYESGTPEKANAVWTSACNDNARGQHWEFVYASGNVGTLRSAYPTYLRTSPGTGQAVYTDYSSQTGNDYYAWSTSLD
ncbi:RICIN domain-containing protein [Streptomyces sp. NPDC018031]|uniref:RICIN domain-containing protein n=1 Tax=Streptomyces sp. NPDC018031 TaxID=3365033 RepID=UPI003798EF6C